MTDITKYNPVKFKAMIHYLVEKCKGKENLGKTVLYKLCYFSDFDFYELHEQSITGERYARLPNGPGPRDCNRAIDELVDEGLIEHTNCNIGKDHDGKDIIKNCYKSLKRPDMSLFSSEEILVIDSVISRYGSMSATQISNVYHIDTPWRLAKDLDDIDYEAVFYRHKETSVLPPSEDADEDEDCKKAEPDLETVDADSQVME